MSGKRHGWQAEDPRHRGEKPRADDPRGAGPGGRPRREPELLPPLPVPGRGTQLISLDGRVLTLTNLDKPIWPRDGYTKFDLINYYFRVSGFILPQLIGRPLSLKRYPNGAGAPFFFQKRAAPETPAWIRTRRIKHEDTGESVDYIICDDVSTLLYLANLACISQNPWLSAMPELDRPDILALDLDPSDPDDFEGCVQVALLVKRQLDRFGMTGYPKTSGATGLHVYVPIRPAYTYSQCRQFAKIIALLCREERPDLITLESSLSRRGGKLYLDYMQNVKGKTLASVYSVRARAGAPVSTPLKWDEVQPGLRPTDFTMENTPARLAATGDLFAGVVAGGQDLMRAVKRAERMLG